MKNVKFVVNNATRIALGNGGFGVAQVKGVYALAQCWKTVGYGGCRACLEKAAKAVGKCVPKREARALNAGCYLRYSTEKFFNEKQGSKDSHSKFLFFGFQNFFVVYFFTEKFLSGIFSVTAKSFCLSEICFLSLTFSGFLTSTGFIVAIVISGIAFVMLSLFAAYAVYAKLSNNKGRKIILALTKWTINCCLLVCLN